MKKRSRPKKPPPERVRPVRDFGTLFGEEKPSAEEVSKGKRAKSSAQAPVADAYRVIDDYLRQGRRAAENLWTPLGNLAGAGEPSLLTERFLRGAADLSSAWFDMLQTLSPAEGQRDAPTAPGAFDAGKRQASSVPRKNGAASSLHVEIALQSVRLAQVTVDVFPGQHDSPVSLSILHATDAKTPPLTGVEVQSLGKASAVRVVLRVPEAQPPGRYHGVLLAGPERRPCGSLTLELLEE